MARAVPGDSDCGADTTQEGGGGMIVTRLREPSKEQLTAIEFHRRREQQAGEVVAASAGKEARNAAV